MRLISGLLLVAGLLGAQGANAQVYKCTEADGKTVYSQAPCTKTGSKEKFIRIVDTPMGDPPPQKTLGQGMDSTSDSQRASVATSTLERSKQTLPLPSLHSRKHSTAAPPSVVSDQQLIAECEANRGARCSSAEEIRVRRIEKQIPSPQQQAEIQAAVRARRDREEAARERAFSRP